MTKRGKLEREWAIKVLFTLVTGKDAEALKHGAKLRNAMIEDLKAGKTPMGYRPQWIRTKARELVRTLSKIAGEFNDAHPLDQCSVMDLMDILSTATNMLSKASNGSESPPQEHPKVLA